jgi:hypothetical protein
MIRRDGEFTRRRGAPQRGDDDGAGNSPRGAGCDRPRRRRGNRDVGPGGAVHAGEDRATEAAGDAAFIVRSTVSARKS